MLQVTPIVSLADDDVCVRESLELLTRCEGWQPETFASAQEFLEHPRTPVPSCLILDISLLGLAGLDLQRLVAVDRSDFGQPLNVAELLLTWRRRCVLPDRENGCEAPPRPRDEGGVKFTRHDH